MRDRHAGDAIWQHLDDDSLPRDRPGLNRSRQPYRATTDIRGCRREAAILPDHLCDGNRSTRVDGRILAHSRGGIHDELVPPGTQDHGRGARHGHVGLGTHGNLNFEMNPSPAAFPGDANTAANRTGPEPKAVKTIDEHWLHIKPRESGGGGPNTGKGLERPACKRTAESNVVERSGSRILRVDPPALPERAGAVVEHRADSRFARLGEGGHDDIRASSPGERAHHRPGGGESRGDAIPSIADVPRERVEGRRCGGSREHARLEADRQRTLRTVGERSRARVEEECATRSTQFIGLGPATGSRLDVAHHLLEFGEHLEAINGRVRVVQRRWRLLEGEPVMPIADRRLADDTLRASRRKLIVGPPAKSREGGIHHRTIAVVVPMPDQHPLQCRTPHRIRVGVVIGVPRGDRRDRAVVQLARAQVSQPFAEERLHAKERELHLGHRGGVARPARLFAGGAILRDAVNVIKESSFCTLEQSVDES